MKPESFTFGFFGFSSPSSSSAMAERAKHARRNRAIVVRTHVGAHHHVIPYVSAESTTDGRDTDGARERWRRRCAEPPRAAGRDLLTARRIDDETAARADHGEALA